MGCGASQQAATAVASQSQNRGHAAGDDGDSLPELKAACSAFTRCSSQGEPSSAGNRASRGARKSSEISEHSRRYYRRASSLERPEWVAAGSIFTATGRENFAKTTARLLRSFEQSLSGDFFSAPIPVYFPRVLKFFVSSTFTDTTAERDAFMARVYPVVRARARMLRVTFEPAEMRWGIRAASNDDNRTEELCMRKLAECKRESGGLFFLSVWADKYGFCPIPRSVLSSEFAPLLERMDSKQRALFDDCYALDENAEPAEYVLRRGVT